MLGRCVDMEPLVQPSSGRRYLYRPVDQYGQVIDVMLSEQRKNLHPPHPSENLAPALASGALPA
jgi:hypothetical protein